MKRIQQRHEQEGFTLVELLIALALGLIVLGAVLGIFNSSQQSYNVQEDIAAMQQDVRVGRTFLERDIRVAGRGLGDDFRFLGERVFPFTFENGAGEGGSDKLLVRYVQEIGGCPPGSGGTPKCTDLPVLHSVGQNPDLTDPNPNSNRVNIDEDMSDTDTYDGWLNGCYCGDEFHEVSNSSPLMGIITSPDGKDSDVILLTKAQKTGGVSFLLNNKNTSYDADGDGEDESYENKLGNTYPPDSTIQFYYLDQWADPAWEVVGTELKRSGQTVCEHIEDLQFAFWVDRDDDGVEDAGEWVDGNDTSVLTAGGDLLEADKPFVRSVRVTLVGRTAMEHKDLAANSRPAIEDHAAGSADHFRRRISQVTLEIRNMGL